MPGGVEYWGCFCPDDIRCRFYRLPLKNAIKKQTVSFATEPSVFNQKS
jgi:hypothetical protein